MVELCFRAESKSRRQVDGLFAVAFTKAEDGIQQLDRVRVLRAAEDLADPSLLDDLALLHDDDPIGEVGDDAHIVGDQQNRRTQTILQVTHEVEDLSLDCHVKSRCRLVRDQQFGVEGKRHGDHRTLTLAAGELVGVGLESLDRVGHLDELEHLERALLGVCRKHLAVNAQCFHDLEADGEHRVHCCHRLLEDGRHTVSANLAHLRVRQADQLISVEANRSGDPGRIRQKVEDRHRAHALSRAGLADNCDDFALADLE